MGKDWWKSKTLWAGGVEFIVLILTTAGLLTIEQGAALGTAVLTILLMFLRLGVGTPIKSKKNIATNEP